ncbi:hypothetical protein ACM44_04645 [Chryseobacterium koreense CCUG 49689]|uniref:Uncharacterized protein n=1 Tax=Chryseobacterium koreense CCUG 49689 TaxID=1304281 RepID=A0A0J7J1J2_9FLAO|nr:hypothetical protein ACM44_04645 [Chryseobacterium koreense CCUG 49689]
MKSHPWRLVKISKKTPLPELYENRRRNLPNQKCLKTSGFLERKIAKNNQFSPEIESWIS